MIAGIPLPATDDPLEQPFWQGLAQGELLIQQCSECAQWLFPPRRHCPTCQRDSLRWTPVSGRGRIWSFTRVHPPVLEAFAPYAPYPVVLVELDESPQLRLVGNLIAAPGAAIDSVDAASIRIGARVQALLEPLAPDVVWPRWQLI